MHTAHGTFVPAGTDGFFFLWVMDPAAEAPVDPPRGRSPHPDPRALPPSRLFPLLQGLPYCHATDLVLLPPAGERRPWRLPGLALPVASAVQWCVDLQKTFAGSRLLPGQSLRAWSAAAKLLLELLGRGRFLPSLRLEAGCHVAEWRLAAPEPADAERLQQVAAALPGVCRAVVPPDRNFRRFQPATAGALLDRFLRAGAAGLIPPLLAGSEEPSTYTDYAPAAQYWLLALTGHWRRDLPPGLPDAGTLYAAAESWSAPALAVRGAAGLRTGLRLQVPAATPTGDWELELMLQAPGDPPLSVPAAAAWLAVGDELTIGSERYLHADQRLRADLPGLVRLFPPLAPLLTEPVPTSLPVAEATVLELLRSGIPRLQAAGVPVLLPTSLVRSDHLRARLHLRPSGQAGAFGLDQLVDVDWELALGHVAVSLDELHALARTKRPLVALRGHWVQVDPEALAAALRSVERHQERLPLTTALRLAAQAESRPEAAAGAALLEGAAAPLLVEAVEAEGWVAEMLARLREPGRLAPVPVPAGLVGELRPYQKRGLDWLAFLHRFGLGACLADDMGLGKTVQVIALLLHEREQGLSHGPTLLVCPVSLVGNWRRELARFAPSLRVLVHHGSARAEAAHFAAAAQAHDVVITTYSVTARDEAELAAVAWAGVVTDEAQNLKNPDTQHTRVLRRLTGGYRIALTGTPVENQLGDLWSLFAFLNPGLLGSETEFRRHLALPIERYRDPVATARLRRLVQPLLLRRLKTDPSIISDLPEKQEMPVFVNLTLEQAALYEAVVAETLEASEANSGIARHGAVLAGLTRLKQVCNHPATVAGDSGPLAGRSGKLERLTEMLQEMLAEGDSALIFTQYAQWGRRLQQYLTGVLDCPVLCLDGSTPQPERERLIAAFQSGAAPLFVLSLKAGGVGLNLTAANRVIHYDRWWNPAVEDQATDRAYRIGQDRRVLVHKLVTAGTLEERLDRLLTEKRALADAVVGAGEAWLGNLSTDELRALIALERE